MRGRGGREAGRDVTRRAWQVVMICHAFFRGHKEKRHPDMGCRLIYKLLLSILVFLLV